MRPPFLPILLLVALLALALGCGEESDQLTVRICGDIPVPAGLTEVRVSVLDNDRQPRHAGVMDLLVCPQEIVRKLPQDIKISALPGAQWVVVQGLQDGVEVVRFERRVDPDGSRLVVAPLRADCLRASCPLGQTCVEGTCVIVAWETAANACKEPTPEPSDIEEELPSPDPDVVEEAAPLCPTPE